MKGNRGDQYHERNDQSLHIYPKELQNNWAASLSMLPSSQKPNKIPSWQTAKVPATTSLPLKVNDSLLYRLISGPSQRAIEICMKEGERKISRKKKEKKRREERSSRNDQECANKNSIPFLDQECHYSYYQLTF